ncbi:MAG TPA: DUF302 domain-containing protein [Patescibacteria group bacterium]|nr:DUF302 domain-containing protein [Patescibacteria group bacterium]
MNDKESMHKTPYGYALRVEISFDDAVIKAKEAFAVEGFGVLSEIDVAAKVKEKLNKEMDPYVILGMCNPSLAYDALQTEAEIGLLLPCNVIVYRQGAATIIAAQRPDVILGVTGNLSLAEIARNADAKILKALHSLGR